MGHTVINEWKRHGRRFTVVSDHKLTPLERAEVASETFVLECRLRLGVAPLVTPLHTDEAAIPDGVRFDRKARFMRGDGAVSFNPENKRRRDEVPLIG